MADSSNSSESLREFDRLVFAAFRSKDFEVIEEPVVGGQRLDAVVTLPNPDGKQMLAVETRFSRRPLARRSLDAALFRLAYLRNQSLIDFGMVVLNYEVLRQDRDLANELDIPILQLQELQSYLSDSHFLTDFLAQFGRRQAFLSLKNVLEFNPPIKATIIESSVEHPARKRIFVAIEFSDHNEDVFNHGITAVAARLGMEAVRVSDIEHNNLIISEIRHQIELADAVVAELSDDNQNVYYEAGLAHALNKEVILVAKQNTQIRFDLASTNCIFYRNITDLAGKLEHRLRAMFSE